MALWVLRSVFLIVAAGVGAWLSERLSERYNPWLVFGSAMMLALTIIASDVLIRRKNVDVVSSVYFGTVVGVFLSYILGLALDPILPPSLPPNTTEAAVRKSIELVLAMVMVYSCISILLQTRKDFRFIIPYVEFSKEVKGAKPYVLDTSVIIDGRIADVVEARVLDGQLIMPQFVLAELQSIADSSDRLRRNRGRRGLDILNRLRTNQHVDFQVFDTAEILQLNGPSVDLKLVLLAKHLEGKLVTNDYNLNKIASLHGVPVVNLNELSNALRPAFLPGEEISLRVVKAGEEAGQGVGYLDDGTMVVVEGGREHLNKTIEVTVTKILQTSAGRMVFTRLEK